MIQDTSVEIDPILVFDDNWSIPPFCDNVKGKPPPGSPPTPVTRDRGDASILLTQGVVYQLFIDTKTKLQNVSQNEDDDIEWSDHGDPCGTWMQLDRSNMLEVEPGTTLFLYNRTHKQNCEIAVFIG